MVKVTEEKQTEISIAPKMAVIKKSVKTAAWVIVIGAMGFGLWANPQIIEKAKSLMKNPATENMTIGSEVATQDNNELTMLREEINMLRMQLNQLQNQQNQVLDTSALDEKFANLEKTNMNIIDSKADVATILGLITRMDKAEQNLDLLSKVTDDGALSLTAMMMVKDSADRGGSFEYEAAVLQQLTEGNVNVKEPVDKIVKVASVGVKSDAYLINSFNKVYDNLLKIQREEFEKTWKDRVNNKINEYIKIKKVNENSPEFKANKELEQIKVLVDAGNIKKALVGLQNINNKMLLDEESLKQWMEEAQNKTDFSEAVAKVSTYYIAALKINFIKKETKND